MSWTEALTLPGPELMALAWRTPLYDGALAARLLAEHPEAASGSGGRQGGWKGSPARDVPLGGAGTVGSDADGLPLGDLFETG